MKLIKNLPNILTLFNLFLGCMAIIYIFQDHMVILQEENQVLINLGQIHLACYCIFLAAIIDFCDGFVARLLNAQSVIGKQLDSLADMVTFGVVPGLILYELMARSYYASFDAFDYPILFFAFGFIVTISGAFRLAKFNIDERQIKEFRGLPIPSMALIVASLPLIILHNEWGISNLLENKWMLFLIIILLSYLMVSDIPMMSLKFSFKKKREEENAGQFIYILMLLATIIILLGIFVFHVIFILIPIILFIYIILSITKNILENGL